MSTVQKKSRGNKKARNRKGKASIKKEANAPHECIQKTKDAAKSAVEKPKPTELERKIIRQVEYYFSDLNLQRDGFLRNIIKRAAKGWVPISTILTFNRLLSLSCEAEIIVNALLKSDRQLIEVSSDHQSIRRYAGRPLAKFNAEYRKDISSRTVYVEEFPSTISISELIEFFESYEEVAHIQKLNEANKLNIFSGSVYVTFMTKEQAQTFIDQESVTYNGLELMRQWKEKHLQNQLETLQKTKKPKEKVDKMILPRDSVIYFKGATANVTREILSASIKKVDNDVDIAYVDFSIGQRDGYVRFASDKSAVHFIEKLPGRKLKLGNKVEVRVCLPGAKREEKYLQAVVKKMVLCRCIKNPPKKTQLKKIL